jgi:hypothetical protein
VENKIEVKQAALWVKKTRTDNDYCSVKVELADGQTFWVNLFANDKSKPTQPDFKTIVEKKSEEPLPEGIPF